MLQPITAAELASCCDLTLEGPFEWSAAIPIADKGIYIVSCDNFTRKEVFTPTVTKYWKRLNERWQSNQSIIYIGKAERSTLRKRLSQFFKHKYGNTGPHCGGQSILLLEVPKKIYFYRTSDPAKIEHKLLKTYKKMVGDLPFGNIQYPSCKWSCCAEL